MILDKRMKILAYILLFILVFSAGCQPQTPTAEPMEDTTEAEPMEETTEEEDTSPEYKLGVIMPGPIEDADFNSLGYEAVQRIKGVYGIEVDFSEKVAVADAERVGREYIGSGYNIIAYHGGQFVAAAMTLVEEYPDVAFIIYTAGENPEYDKDNVWNVGLRYFPASYPVGVIAANVYRCAICKASVTVIISPEDTHRYSDAGWVKQVSIALGNHSHVKAFYSLIDKYMYDEQEASSNQFEDDGFLND